MSLKILRNAAGHILMSRVAGVNKILMREERLKLTWNSIANVPVVDASNVAQWNTFFGLSVNSSIFTSVVITGNDVSLIGGSEITLKDNLFKSNVNLLNVQDTGCIIVMGDNCFDSCTSLVSPSFPALILAKNSCFYNCTSLTNPSFPVLASTGYSCFIGCTGLVSLSFPALTSVGYYCFYNCRSLVSTSFPALTSAGDDCFGDCTKLVNPSFPALTSAGNYCFSNCTGLVNPSFPALTSVGYSCFLSCTGLKNINLPSAITLGMTVLDDYVFLNITRNIITLTIPAALMTCNAGLPDGDIQYLMNYNTVTIITV